MKTVLLFAFGLITPILAIDSKGVSPATMTNLQAAFNGESNARARYLAFAEKADEEGYSGAASLFRAAARAEGIHASNHAAVITKFGGVADPRIEPPNVKSTSENLAAAISGETYERDEMYPAFIRQAESENAADAVRTFNFALAAEAEHARLYTITLANLATMTSSRVFYVCPTCGFTTDEVNFEQCPTCGTPKEQFELVS